MDDRTHAELSREEMTEFHTTMFQHCQSRLKTSRTFMSTFYDTWMDRHYSYQSFKKMDANDRKAIEEGRPSKQVLPMTFAKVHTFKSFLVSLFTQRGRIFELESKGVEDYDYVELAESVLDADLRANKFDKVLRQHVTDIAKFGLGVMKHSWEEEYAYVPMKEEDNGIVIFGIRITKPSANSKVEKILRRQGNCIKAVSVFDFLPDPRFPLTDLHKGEFCGDETDMSRQELMQKEGEKTVAGIKHLQAMSKEFAYANKKHMRRSRINFDEPTKTNDIVRLAEIQIKITPANFMLSDGKPLGPETYPVMYLVWIGNMNRVLRCEPMGYLHGQFTYEAAQFDEDETNFVNQSLTDVLDKLQETADWFLNARVEAVTRTIDNQLIVDPLGVDMSTITNRSRVILLKKGAARTGVDRYIKQLQVQDVTSRHLDDINNIMSYMQAVSGVNENAMGQYHSGRRSATEARVVSQGASSRLKEIASAIWASSIAPTGHKLLLNLRQGMTEEMVLRVAGQEWAAKPEAVAAFLASPTDLIQNTDFFVYDGTLASEKAYLAQTLKELFEQVIGLGAQGMMQLEVSPKLILEHIYKLLGVGSIRQFDLQKDPQTLSNVFNQMMQDTLMQMQEQQAQQNGPGTAPTQ